MQIDSELNVDVAVESQPALYKVRRETWGWHTNGYEEMNPGEQLIDPVVSNRVFKERERLLTKNKDAKISKQSRIMPLLVFDLINKDRVYTQDLD